MRKKEAGGVDKVVLAYSGGLDTTVSIRWLQDKYKMDVVTVTVDMGQQEDLAAIAKRAESLQVAKHYGIDAKAEFLREHVFPAIKANAMYERDYPLSSALSRPLIASKLVEVAAKEGAVAAAHGCTGKGNDQVRFEVAIRSLAPELKIIAPVREWGLDRAAETEYAKKQGIPLKRRESVYSTDQNLWGRSIECGPLEHPEDEPPEDIWLWTRSLREAPNEPEKLEVGFERGVPVALNGERMEPEALVRKVNAVAGAHGIGRIDHVEDRIVGVKSRECYECPAALSLIRAHEDLEKLVLTPRELSFKRAVDEEWASLVYQGLWTDPLRSDLDAFIDHVEERVTGTVRLRLFKGACHVLSRASPLSLYDFDLATYEAKTTFNQAASAGFIELWGLPTVHARKVLTRRRVKAER